MMRTAAFLSLIVIVPLTGLTWAARTDPSSDVTDPDPLKSLAEPAPIIVWNRTITVLRAANEESPPADRAKRAVARIEALPVRPGYELSTVEAYSKGVKGIIIKTQTKVLFALLPEDVDPDSGQTLEAMSQASAERIKMTLEERARQMKWSNLARSIGFTAAATLSYGLLIGPALRLRRIAIIKLENRIAQRRGSLTIASINLVPILGFVGRITTRLALIAIFVTVTHLWLTFCFARFFFTHPWADQLGDCLAGFLKSIALAMIGAIPGLFTVGVVFWLTRIATSGVSRFFVGAQKGMISVSWVWPIAGDAADSAPGLICLRIADCKAPLHPTCPGVSIIAPVGVACGAF